VISQVMACVMAQGEKALIASMEMRPRLTLNRMARQCTKQREPGVRQIDEFNSWTEGRLWIYDHLGSVQWQKLLAVFRWAADKLGINHFVIDSLMRCGIREDDYSGQKDFVDALCTFKSDYNCAVHLVMHARKGQDEYSAPGKFDAKGTGTMTDLADNVVTVWRNKKKEAQAETGMLTEDMAKAPDAMLICDKQRNFDWEGRIGLWYHRDSMQFVESAYGEPIELMEWGA
jgi:twinkle protein